MPRFLFVSAFAALLGGCAHCQDCQDRLGPVPDSVNYGSYSHGARSGSALNGGGVVAHEQFVDSELQPTPASGGSSTR